MRYNLEVQNTASRDSKNFLPLSRDLTSRHVTHVLSAEVVMEI